MVFITHMQEGKATIFKQLIFDSHNKNIESETPRKSQLDPESDTSN